MKTTFKFIIAAMAAISVFSSCQKELANETVNNTTGGVRTIAVQFDNSTKATLDGFTPKFANGDAIRVSNTEKSEECTVSVDGSGNATFTTTLSGDLNIFPNSPGYRLILNKTLGYSHCNLSFSCGCSKLRRSRCSDCNFQ